MNLTTMKLGLLVTALIMGLPRFTSGAEQRFQALIIGVDPSAKTIRVRHRPTGFETDLVWDEKTRVQATIRYSIHDVPEGWVECMARKIDPKTRSISKLAVLRQSTQPPESTPTEPKDGTPFRAKLVRAAYDHTSAEDDRFLMTEAGDKRYELEIDGVRWTLEGNHGIVRPLTRDEKWTPEQLKAGQPCQEVAYMEEPGGNRLSYALVLPNQDFQMKPHAGRPTGLTAGKVAEELVRIRAAYERLAPEMRKTAPVRFKLEPEIALPGEPVTLSIEAWAAQKPNAAAEIHASYLVPERAAVRQLNLDWKANEVENGLTRYLAEVKLPELPIGQHYVSWKCDIGGDIPEFWRGLAVADPKTLVVIFHHTNGRIPTQFDEHRLPFDTWTDPGMCYLSGPFGERSAPGVARQWLERSQKARARGAAPVYTVLGGGYAGRGRAPIFTQFSFEPEDVQLALFKAALEIAKYSGFDPEELSFGAYELGTRSLAMAREAGVRQIGALCIHQNWADGLCGINHSARPLRPYFNHPDDFRKAGPGGKDGIVMVSQHDKSLLWKEYGIGVFEPCWLEWEWVGGGGGGRETYDEVFMSRHFHVLEAALQNLQNQKVPFFQSIGIEFTGTKEVTTQANTLMINHLVELARKGRVVFCHGAAAANFYRRHYQETPETLFYDADFWCGTKADKSITSTWKPLDYPDLIHIENSRYSAYFKKPGALPEYHWDYTKPWNFPDWGNEDIKRSVNGFLVPGEHDKFAVTPKITDTRKIQVEQKLVESPAGLEVQVTLETPEALKSWPVALWDLPREWKAGEGWWSVLGANRFVPIRAPYTGNLNGLLEVDAKPGRNQYTLKIQTPKRQPESQDILLEKVHAKVFTLGGETMAYVWAMQPWATEFELTVPAGKSAQYYPAPKGERVDLAPGVHRLTINKESWSRIVGLTCRHSGSGSKSSVHSNTLRENAPSRFLGNCIWCTMLMADSGGFEQFWADKRARYGGVKRASACSFTGTCRAWSGPRSPGPRSFPTFWHPTLGLRPAQPLD